MTPRSEVEPTNFYNEDFSHGKIEQGFNRLGHVKSPKSPKFKSMLSRPKQSYRSESIQKEKIRNLLIG